MTVNPEHRVFISYAHADRSCAKALARELGSAGINVWNEQIEPDAALDTEIQDALREASAVVLITSKNSLTSQYVNYEIGSALAADKRVIPVLVDDVESLPSYLHNAHAIDARGLDGARMGAEVAAALR